VALLFQRIPVFHLILRTLTSMQTTIEWAAVGETR
jgi:hypothetical protein